MYVSKRNFPFDAFRRRAKSIEKKPIALDIHMNFVKQFKAFTHILNYF